MKDPLGRKLELRREKEKKFGDKIRFFLKAGWTFYHPVEKIILLIIFFWAFYAFLKYVVVG